MAIEKNKKMQKNCLSMIFFINGIVIKILEKILIHSELKSLSFLIFCQIKF
jgi:hypothetical protein